MNTPKNAKKGIAAINSLAEDGDSWAQRRLAMLYADGKVIERDVDKAFRLMRSAAASGDITAKKQLVDMLVKFNDEALNCEIFVLRLELAERGETTSQRNLAEMYLNGKGVEKNEEEAIRWYKEAAKRGDMTSRNMVAKLLRQAEK